MGRIARLPDAVANQIAAGEVVERPAAVVKELLENAVDADAHRIDINVRGGGVELIRIVDDGSGMSREDAVLSLERHATSKIRSVEEIAQVRSLGFRGEAIPSIASVSDFVLTTKPDGASEATQVHVKGGELVSVESRGAPIGTAVEVRDLFYNVPARRKFLKRPQTELSHILDAVHRLALDHPNLSMKLLHEGRVLFDVPRLSPTDPKGRLSRILGKKAADRMFAIPDDGRAHEVQVTGYISAPDLTERTAQRIHTFVNGRFIRDRTIQHAIQDAYRTLLERGRHPVVVLSVRVDPESVDVNVHPQKTEVRFRDTSAIHRAVRGALVRTLAGEPWLSSLRTNGHDSHDGPKVTTYTLDHQDPRTRSGFLEHRFRVAEALRKKGQNQELGKAWDRRLEGGRSLWSSSESEGFRNAEVKRSQPSNQIEGLEAEGLFGHLSPVGQVLSTYLVCEGRGRLFIIDQHAAHERITFEHLRKQHREGGIAVQPLLIPMTMELDPSRAEVALAESDRLRELGFELEPFGETTWSLKTLPVELSAGSASELVLALLDELREIGRLDRAEALDAAMDQLLSRAACHASVRSGDKLTSEEIRALLEEMDRIDFGANCPHGRPVFIEIPESDLEKMFHRS